MFSVIRYNLVFFFSVHVYIENDITPLGFCVVLRTSVLYSYYFGFCDAGHFVTPLQFATIQSWFVCLFQRLALCDTLGPLDTQLTMHVICWLPPKTKERTMSTHHDYGG
jgi:hypothetical protein